MEHDQRPERVDPAVAGRWETLRKRLEHDVAGLEGTHLLIPGWAPTDIHTGLHWAREFVFEGWYVDYAVERLGEPNEQEVARLWLKAWEYGDPEPPWEQIKAEREMNG